MVCLPRDGNALSDRSALVGRELELARIDEFLESVATHVPRALLIEGSPGAGKTALWREGIACARARRYRTLVARPVEVETALSFASLGDLLDPVLGKGMPSLPEPQRQALEIALLLRPADSGPDGRALATAVTGLLRVSSAETAVIVAIDDVQWLDSASAGVLAFAARRLAAQRVGFMLTRRIESDRGPLPLETALEDSLERVRPSPLSLGALNRLLQERFGHAFSRPLVRRIREVSGGNPFFTLELARALEESATTGAAPHDLPLPATLREVVENRLAALPAAERNLLVAIAALSQPTFAVLAAANDRTLDESVLRRSLEKGVVELEGDRLRFSHPLLASAAYMSADTASRRRLHRRLAEVVSDPEESVQHLALAATGPDDAVASTLEEVAAAVRQRGAPDRAAALLARATELTPLGDSAAHRRRLAAADCWTDAGDAVRAVPLLEAAVADSSSGDERAAALARLGWIQCRSAGYREGSRLFEEAAREQTVEARVRISIEKGRSWADEMLGDLAAAEVHASAAAELAEEIGDPLLLAQSLGDLGFIELLRGRSTFRATMKRALAHEPRRGVRDPAAARWIDVRTRWFGAVVLAWTDELDGSRAALLALRAETEVFGHEQVLPNILNWLGRVDCFAGNWRAGLASARGAYDAAVQAGLSVERPYTLATIALAHAHLGEVEAARDALAEGLLAARQLEVVPGTFELLAAQGFLELSLARPQEAHATLADLAQRAATAGFVQPATQRFQPDLIEASLAIGDLDCARRVQGELEQSAVLLKSPWTQTMAARCAGMITAAEGNLEEALVHLEHALREHQRLPDPFERGRTLLQHGIVLRRLKRKRAARASIASALSTFGETDSPLWAERARSELARISGGNPRVSSSLTETEARVAVLVAAGRANKEVAAELHVTVRTVESNLTRIYRKLGVRSRGQLAAKLPTIH